MHGGRPKDGFEADAAGAPGEASIRRSPRPLSQGGALEAVRVYDPVLILLHAWNGIQVLLLLATGIWVWLSEPGADRAAVVDLHAAAGNLLAVGLSARLAWAVVGPAAARLSAYRRSFRQTRPGAGGGLDRHREAAAAYLGFYGATVLVILSGFALLAIDHGDGPLARWLYEQLAAEEAVRWLHRGAAWLIAGFLVAHWAGLILAERREGIPYAQAMVSGVKYRRVADSRRKTGGDP